MRLEQQQKRLKAAPDKALGGGAAPPLGIYAKSHDISESRLQAFELQSIARGLLPKGFRTKNCLRLKVAATQQVGIKYKQQARYSGLQTCSSVWSCPVCARAISEHRRAEMTTALSNWRQSGGSVYLLTLTFPHKRQDKLGSLLDKFAAAQVSLRSSRVFTEKFVRDFQVAGTVRALEVTVGQNGWHPHAHVLVFAEQGKGRDKPDPQICEQIKAVLLPEWQKACLKAGLEMPSEAHGIDVRDGSYAQKYVSKWGLESEMTKAHIKKSKSKDGLTPFDLLRWLSNSQPDGDMPPLVAAAPALFREYSEQFRGKRQLVFSRGLRDLLGLGKEKSDEEAAHVEDGALPLAFLSDEDWRLIVAKNQRGELLEAVNRTGGSANAVHTFLMHLRATNSPPRGCEPPQSGSATQRADGASSEVCQGVPQDDRLHYSQGEFAQQRGALATLPPPQVKRRGQPIFSEVRSTKRRRRRKNGLPAP